MSMYPSLVEAKKPVDGDPNKVTSLSREKRDGDEEEGGLEGVTREAGHCLRLKGSTQLKKASSNYGADPEELAQKNSARVIR